MKLIFKSGQRRGTNIKANFHPFFFCFNLNLAQLYTTYQLTMMSENIKSSCDSDYWMSDQNTAGEEQDEKTIKLAFFRHIITCHFKGTICSLCENICSMEELLSRGLTRTSSDSALLQHVTDGRRAQRFTFGFKKWIYFSKKQEHVLY